MCFLGNPGRTYGSESSSLHPSRTGVATNPQGRKRRVGHGWSHVILHANTYYLKRLVYIDLNWIGCRKEQAFKETLDNV